MTIAERREKLTVRVAGASFFVALVLMFVGGSRVFGSFDPWDRNATIVSVMLGVIYAAASVAWPIALAVGFSRFRPKIREIKEQIRDSSILALQGEVAELRKEISALSRRDDRAGLLTRKQKAAEILTALIAYSRGLAKGPTDASGSDESRSRREHRPSFPRVRIQLEAVERDEQRASHAHQFVNDILYDENRLSEMIGGSVKVLHLLIGHKILRGSCGRETARQNCSRIGAGKRGAMRE